MVDGSIDADQAVSLFLALGLGKLGRPVGVARQGRPVPHLLELELVRVKEALSLGEGKPPPVVIIGH